MTPAKQKEKLRDIVKLMHDNIPGDYNDGLDELGFQELVDLVDYHFRHEFGCSVKFEICPPPLTQLSKQ